MCVVGDISGEQRQNRCQMVVSLQGEGRRREKEAFLADGMV